MLRTLQSTEHPQGPIQLLTQELPIFLAQANQEASSLSAGEGEQCRELMEGIIACQPALKNKLEKIQQRVHERTYNKGIGYFNAKNLIFLEYLIQLQFYQLFKLNAIDLTKDQGLQVYKRLVYLKTLMMKLSPVEKKLEYQKNKLLKISDLVTIKSDNVQTHQAEAIKELSEQDQDDNEEDEVEKEKESESEDDALAYQPRPQSLMIVKKKKEESNAKTGKYVAPKISATLSKQDKIRRRQELLEERRKVFLIRKYRDDLIEDDEAREEGVENELAEKIKRKFKEKTSIEEDNFVRFPQSKKDKFWKKQLIQKYNKTDQLKDTLRQVEMVGQIYRKKVQQQSQNTPKQRETDSSRTKVYKAGPKKQKRQ